MTVPPGPPAAPPSSGIGKTLGGLAGYEIGNEVAHDIIDVVNSYLPNVLTMPAQNLLTLIIIGVAIYYTPAEIVSKLTSQFK